MYYYLTVETLNSNDNGGWIERIIESIFLSIIRYQGDKWIYVKIVAKKAASNLMGKYNPLGSRALVPSLNLKIITQNTLYSF